MLTVKVYDNYFAKIILLMILSISAFYLFKTFLPSRLFSEQVAGNDNIVMDSLMLAAINDTTEVGVKDTLAIDSVQTVEADVNFNPTISAEGYSNLRRFYAKLYALENDKSKKVRVAYYGDSMNDGDYIVQDVRSELQAKYGGQGVGFVSITSLSSGARGSISHLHSKNWLTQSFIKVKKPARPFGVDGQVFFANDRSQTYWVKYKAQSQKYSTSLYNPTLFYGSSASNEDGSISVTIDKDSVSTHALHPKNLLNTLRVSNNTQSLKVEFSKADSIPIYGLNFDDGKGVHIDNFSGRGNSGLPLSMLNTGLMNAFDKELNYDLIILQYGANVLGYGSLNYGWYEKNMTTVVANLRASFPNADILVISTGDKASKIDGVMQTDPAVVPLANAQKSYARKTNSGYISLYSLMGGQGSMVTWVDSNLAGKDYTHFNASGSKKVGKLISDEIERGYTKYKQENKGE